MFDLIKASNISIFIPELSESYGKKQIKVMWVMCYIWFTVVTDFLLLPKETRNLDLMISATDQNNKVVPIIDEPKCRFIRFVTIWDKLYLSWFN